MTGVSQVMGRVLFDDKDTYTELCKNIPAMFRESLTSRPKITKYFDKPFPKPGRNVFTLLCTIYIKAE